MQCNLDLTLPQHHDTMNMLWLCFIERTLVRLGDCFMGLPPVEPPDLRNRRQYPPEDDDDQNYPPRDYTPPPRRQADPPPQPARPPVANNYPLEDDYPPRGHDPRQPEGLEPVSAPDLRRGRRETVRPMENDLGDRLPPRDARRATSDMRSLDPEPLGSLDSPDLRRARSARIREVDDLPPSGNRPPRPTSTGDFIQEHQVEAIAAGITLLMLGVGILLLIVADGTFLFQIFPMLGGLVLIGGGLFQKVIRGWNVSWVTWGIGGVLFTFGLTTTFNRNGDLVTGSIFFCGTLIILMGLVFLLQVFRR